MLTGNMRGRNALHLQLAPVSALIALSLIRRDNRDDLVRMNHLGQF